MKQTQPNLVGSFAGAWAAVGLTTLALLAVAFFLSQSSRPEGESPRSVTTPPDPTSAATERAISTVTESERVSASAEAVETPSELLAPPQQAAQPAAQFWGRAIADESGAPLANARVTLGESPEAESTATNVDGHFTWPLDESRKEELRIQLPGRAARLVWTRPGHADAAHAVEVRLALGATIDARIVQEPSPAIDGLRLVALVPRNALQDLTDQVGFAPDVVFEEPFTSDGRALFADLAPRAPLALEVRGRDGFVRRLPDTVVLEPGEIRVIEIDLRRGTRLSVRVVDQNGEPVPARDLLLVRQPQTPPEKSDACYLQLADDAAAFARARTDGTGLAVFDEVPEGAWWLGPTKQNPSPKQDDVAAVAQRIELEAGARERELTLYAHRGLYLRGQIVDSTGAPVSRAFVGCEHETIGGYVTGDVDAEGHFELGPVAGGTHFVRAIPHGVYIEPEPQHAAPDETPLLIVLKLGGHIAGIVIDSATRIGTRADFVCSRLGGEAPLHGSLGEHGEFMLSGLAPGTSAIAARTEDGRAGYVDDIELAPAGKRGGVVVELAPAARVAVVYSGGPERAHCRLSIGGAVVALDEVSRGIRSEWFVPVGRVSVLLSHGTDAPAIREVDAVFGDAVEVVVALD